MKTIEVAAAAIKRELNGETQYFIAERDHGDLKGKLEFPGGKVEPGELPEQAAVREIREELSANIKVDEKIGVVDYDYPEFHLHMHLFSCSVVSGELILSEHASAKWVKAEDFGKEKFTPADAIAAEMLRRQKK